MKISTKRILYLDEVRSLAIILVVLGHLIRSFSHDFASWQICCGVFSLTRIGVPLFFTVSGALLLNKNDSLKKFFKKRLSRLFIPFLFWVLVYIAYSAVYIKHGFYLDYAIDVFFGTSSTFGVIFWFIWMIIIVYIGIAILCILKLFLQKRINNKELERKSPRVDFIIGLQWALSGNQVV